MKKRTILIALLSLLMLTVKAQDGGIQFEDGNWQEIKEKAIKENKLIFVDFYTEWCGPCFAMAEDVFPLMEVGSLYNTNFVNVKIDAEKGEGKTLREKYKVVSYPTFLFIDPKSEEIIHRSSSRQEEETFLFTGRSAITPSLRSPYLEKEYDSGNRERKFLENYMDYLASIYKRNEVSDLVTLYTAIPDFSLKNKADWKVFIKHIGGTENPQFQEVMNNKQPYVALYGSNEVDNKLYKEFNYTSNIEALENAPDFKGKDFLLKKNRAEKYLRSKNYEAAIPLLDAMMADPGEFKDELCQYLKFTARSSLYGKHPDYWLKKCAELAQYVAYNSPNRQDTGIHYDYARILEKLIQSVPEAGKYFPTSIIEKPINGAEKYSLRSPKLKQKPSASASRTGI